MTDFIQGLLGALLTRSTGWLGGGLEVVAQDDTVLTVRGGGRDVVFNKRHGTVKSGASLLARFGDIQSVDIRRHVGDDDGPEHWSVGLKLRGWFSRVQIGRTGDAVEASIVAARICTCTGRKVRSL